MIENYNTIIGEFSDVTVIERSKFICYLKGIEDEEQAKSFIIDIKKQNSLANHNCYAYITDDKGLVMKFSDDGEPQGTAGLPMLEVLKNKRLYKTVAVVTRYFGGIKLGTGGLTRAYGGAVTSCLAKAKTVVMQKGLNCLVVSDYESYSKLLKALTNQDIYVNDTTFDDKICVDFVVKPTYFGKLQTVLSDIYKGKVDLTVKGEDFFSFGELCQK